ncbi:hypothetical protein [Streptomyces sp. NPDC001450]
MPSPKLRADQHLLVIVAACSAVDPMGASELATATGMAAKNCGLVPVFAMNTGLLTKGHRRATYLPSDKGRYVARAFTRGEVEGLEALRTKWKGQWFARTVRERCRYGPVSREGLVAKLMVSSTRFYHRIAINCPAKTHTLRIRCDETDEDRQIDPKTKKQHFNRTEHLRQVPPDTPAGRRLKGFRQDSESIHSRFDQSYPHKRVPAYGARGALLIYLGYAWLNNSITRALNTIFS